MELIYLMMAFHFASTICIVFGFLVFLKDALPKIKTEVPRKPDAPTQKDAQVKRKPVVMDDEKAFNMQKDELSKRRPTI